MKLAPSGLLVCALAVSLSCGTNAFAAETPALPDIASRSGITIGGAIGGAGAKFTSWGGSVALTDADAFMMSNGRCAFNLAYDQSNSGTLATPAAYRNMLTAKDTPVSVNSNLTLDAGGSRTIYTQAYLPPGIYDLHLNMDVDGSVAEMDEANNSVLVHVNLNSVCGAAATQQPPVVPQLPAATPPDLVAREGITIGGAVGGSGGKFVPWGGSVILTDADAFLMSGGRCAFNVAYGIANRGTTVTPAFGNVLSARDATVAINSNLTLDGGTTRTILTQPYLPTGNYVLQLKLDNENKVTESDEGNNLSQVFVTLNSLCGAAPPAPKPDLTSLSGMTIGGKFSSWGGTVSLRTADSYTQSNGKCAFNTSYDVENIGAAAASSFAVRLYNGTSVISQQSGLTLAAGKGKQISLPVFLPPGASTLRLVIDDDKKVTESNENNNVFEMKVMLDSNCTLATIPKARK